MNEQEFLAACRYAAWVEAATYAQAVQDWEKACVYAQAVQDHTEQAAALGLGQPGQHQAPVGQAPVTFARPDGQQVTMTVQEMATSLGGLLQYREETITSGRHAYVDDLAKHGKIGQPQVETMKGLVGGMTTAQFDAFKASYDAMGTAALFGQFGGQDGGQPAPTTVQDEIDTLEEIVQNHRNRGASEKEIEGMASFKKLQTLKAQQGQG